MINKQMLSLSNTNWIFSEWNKKCWSQQSPTSIYDVFFFAMQPGLFVPYLIYIVCMVWYLDGPYWMLEDLWPAGAQRPLWVSVTFILIRTILLLPGFLETGRALYVAGLVNLAFLLSIKRLLHILTYKFKSSRDFFIFYEHLTVLWNVLEHGIL